jgi:hypothetical protein
MKYSEKKEKRYVAVGVFRSLVRAKQCTKSAVKEDSSDFGQGSALDGALTCPIDVVQRNRLR